VAIRLNHTIVWCKDKQKSANFLAEVLGRPAPKPFGHFLVVEVDNEVSLDYAEVDRDVAPQHYAFLVDDTEFEPVFERIRSLGLDYWADPGRTQPGQINHRDGGRGVYFPDPDGHLLEVLTRPYGSGA
jgi:catechol 2,3-dioxygenase-like lactoylglutathione lyase family enzyme